MKEQAYPHIKEKIFHEQLENGLRVYLLPKRGFQKSFATFTTHYGSIDNHFQFEGGEEMQVPDGIAHFLEHKMFEKKEGDVFFQFSKQGASANAFTTFDRTSYLFSCTDQLEINLMTLLDFVQTPYFTKDTVAKEQGIIAQEIRMYDDNPDFRVYFNLLQGMYKEHPIHTYIAGTVESIREITPELLYTCYQHFYHPSNMILFLVGDFEPEPIMEQIRQNQSAKSFEAIKEIERYYPFEPEEVHKPKTQIQMSVGNPKCLIGFKDRKTGLSGKELLLQELYTYILLDILFSPSSSLYQELYEEGLIGEDFSADYTGELTYGYSLIGGDTPDPDRLVERMKAAVTQMQTNLCTFESFERSRKKKIGLFLRSLNSLEYIANQFTRYQFNEIDLFEMDQILKELTLEGLHQRIKEHLDLQQMAISIIRPHA